MSDWFDWVGVSLVAMLGLLMAALVGIVGIWLYFVVSCYQSGSPDSMACYMANGSQKRIQIDATVKQ